MAGAKSSSKTIRKPGLINLYWVATEDHDEDWFFFAGSERSAACKHEREEGYDRGEATAELILKGVKLPGLSPRSSPCWAEIPDLTDLGFEVVPSAPGNRSVRFNGRLFVEGHLDSLIAIGEDNRSEAAGRGRRHGTVRPDGAKPN